MRAGADRTGVVGAATVVTLQHLRLTIDLIGPDALLLSLQVVRTNRDGRTDEGTHDDQTEEKLGEAATQVLRIDREALRLVVGEIVIEGRRHRVADLIPIRTGEVLLKQIDELILILLLRRLSEIITPHRMVVELVKAGLRILRAVAVGDQHMILIIEVTDILVVRETLHIIVVQLPGGIVRKLNGRDDAGVIPKRAETLIEPVQLCIRQMPVVILNEDRLIHVLWHDSLLIPDGERGKHRDETEQHDRNPRDTRDDREHDRTDILPLRRLLMIIRLIRINDLRLIHSIINNECSTAFKRRTGMPIALRTATGSSTGASRITAST